MRAPIATTTKIVPKKIVGGVRCHQNGASTPVKSWPVDSPKGCPRPRNAVDCSER